MTYFYLFLAMTFSAFITIGGRLYNAKNADRDNISTLYNLLYAVFAAAGWLVLWLTDFSFDVRVLPYAILYSVGFTCFTIGMLGALKTGSTSITALVKQLALVGVSIWGFVFWDTPFTLLSGIGLVLIVLSLVLCLVTKDKQKQDGNLRKWTFYAALITIGNAGCSIIQRYQQSIFAYQHKNMFMFFGVFFASIVCFLLSTKEKKDNWRNTFRTSWFCPALAGISSVLSNIFILLLVKHQMSPAIMYPGIAVGGLMLTILISLLCFQEKLRRLQWWGLVIGAIALVLLNL